jgi:NADPH-dependent curcumin reductase CurA
VDALGILGMNALTAYFGIIEVGQPQPGETLLVSGAAGSVGSIAAQIGRIGGARVIGICGGSEKAQWLKDSCGIAEVIDYKAEGVGEALDALCPDGVDVFFDNVGGTMLGDVVARMRRHGRVALCGQIATYDDAASNPPLDMMRIIYGAIRLQGFLVPDFADRMPEALEKLSQWDREGLLAHREDVRDGFAALPDTFASLFDGSNNGTLIARIADEDGRPI